MGCPVCSVACNDVLCVCGYSFEDDKIVDLVKSREWINSALEEHWTVRVNRVRAVTRFQERQGISGRQTAKDLGFSVTEHHRTVTLADALDRYPQLAQCANEHRARRRLNFLNNNPPNSNPAEIEAFESEADLQKYLEQNWDATSLGQDWKLYKKGQVDTHSIGIIDLLAQHRNQPRWLVVELKVIKTSDAVLGQLLRYMGWVIQHLAAKNDTVEGLIIASGIDPQTQYGLTCLPSARMKCYRLVEDKLILSEPSTQEIFSLISRLNEDERAKLRDEILKNLDTAQ